MDTRNDRNELRPRLGILRGFASLDNAERKYDSRCTLRRTSRGTSSKDSSKVEKRIDNQRNDTWSRTALSVVASVPCIGNRKSAARARKKNKKNGVFLRFPLAGATRAEKSRYLPRFAPLSSRHKVCEVGEKCVKRGK